MKKAKKFLCIFLSILMALTVATPTHAATAYSNITSDSIKEKQDKIKNSEQEVKDLKAGISDAKKMKQELEALKKDVSAYITKLDSQISEIEDNIETYKGLIADKEAEIVEMTAELEEAIRVQEAQYEAMKKRIQFMYEKGDTFYLELVFGAKSFGDLLTKANYIESLSAYDRKKLDEYTAIREWTALCKETLEAEKVVLDEAKAALESEEESLKEMHAEKEKELAKYTAEINSKNNQIAEYEAALEAEKKAIEELEAAILEEQKQIAATYGLRAYDGGKFCWPAPSYVAITDDFGYRTDPINGSTSYHSGIDMGAPGGSPILAAYDGVVVAAQYNWSMGNYIMINHGDGLYTVYMHASKLLVSPDDVVLKGEQIGCVGTTGRSTGNHLHFSVRLNGTYVSPWPYLGVNR